MSKSLKIKKARHVKGHQLELSFSDGVKQLVDFKPFLSSSGHPEIRKYLKPREFKKFHLDHGDLMWGDFDLIFPIMDLYRGKIDADAGGEAAS